MLIDTHCHLTSERFAADREDVIHRGKQAGVFRAITIGTGCADGQQVRALCQRHPDFLHGAMGLDPFSCHQAGDGFTDELDHLDHLIRSGDFCALGEIGLDYHYDLDPKPVQWQRCAQQLELAQAVDLPVVIHTRESIPDMLALLREHPDNHGVIHSFTGTATEAEAFIEWGWYLSFNGIVTFNNASELRDAALACPADRLLIETDSPYLAPIPKRGKRCEPAYVAHTAAFLADLRGERLDDLIAWTGRNAMALFGLSG
jgi:TatD DNase family protein